LSSRIEELLSSVEMAAQTQRYARRFIDKKLNMPVTSIHQGQVHICAGREAICTVLGSCVSACIRDVELGFGGMNHFLLPSKQDEFAKCSLDVCLYGQWCMELLLNGLYKLGAQKKNLEVKIFGGGNVLEFSSFPAGEKNIEFVRHYLLNEGLEIDSEDVGDIFTRKLYYFPHNGRVKLKRSKVDLNSLELKQEKEYETNLKVEPIVGEIEIFSRH